MSATPATWSIVTFTSDDAALAELASLQPRLNGIRFVAVVPTPMVSPGDVAVLVDQDGRLAQSFGVTGTHTYVLDGRGTVAHEWPGVPDHESVAVYSSRPPLPSGVPAWLFPVLAAAVLIVGIVAWASTRASGTPDLTVPPPAPVAVAPAAAPAPEPAAEPAEPTEAAAAVDAAEAEDAAAGGKPGPGGRKRTPPNLVGAWQIAPKEQAQTIAKLAGDTLTLSALPDTTVSACHTAVPLKGTMRFAADWKIDGYTGKAARLVVKQLDADDRPIRDPAARAQLARGKGTAGWASPSIEVKPAAGATAAMICIDLTAGSGSVSVRKLSPS